MTSPMFHLAARSLRAQFLRFVLTASAVVLGVSFMAGTMILTDTMSASFDRVFESANAGVDAIVQEESPLGDMATDRRRIPESLADDVRGVEGVASVEGTVQGLAQLVQEHAGPMTVTIGTNWIADPALNPLELSAGRAPESGEVVIDRATAEREGWELGTDVTL